MNILPLKTICKLFFYLNLLWTIFPYESYGQNAPPHLKYFGFVAIDCFYDDPLDASPITNYISEVDTFSNLAHMCAFNYTDNIVARTDLMNAHCVNPILHIQGVLFHAVDTLAPSGVNYDLLPDFTARWNTFKTINAAVLTPEKIGCFYIADEPFWNGISLADMDTVCALLKSAFPDIPILTVEAYASVNYMQLSPLIDWVGFVRYGVFDPQHDPVFLQDLDTIKARLNAPHQKLFLIIDDQWHPEYLSYYGWTQDTMAYVVQNYYNLAVSDTNFVGLIGYLWPGGMDAPNHHGVRNLTQAVINKNVQIGQLIKANFSPCNLQNISESAFSGERLSVYPNPASERLNIELLFEPENGMLFIYNSMGQTVEIIKDIQSKSIRINTSNYAKGLYFVVFQDNKRRETSKFFNN